MVKRRAEPEPVAIDAERVDYRGYRSRSGEWIVTRNEKPLPYLASRGSAPGVLTLCRWGEDSPMARVLTWALLVDALEDQDRAAALSDEFHRQYTRYFHVSGWMISRKMILAAAARIEREERDRPRRVPK